MPGEFDDSEWPLITLRQVGSDENVDIEDMLAGLTRRLSRGRCAVVFDTTQSHYPSVGQAQRFAQLEGAWLRQNQPLIARNVVGVAFIITNPAVRFILTSVLLIASLPTGHIVTAEMAEARLYCLGRLRTPSLRPQ